MIDYGKVRSTIAPNPIDITTSKVFIASDITEYEENFDDYFIKGYEYNYKEYTKDEYILDMNKKNKELENQVLDTQMALCDIYEALGGEML